jgi:hypothetical protein
VFGGLYHRFDPPSWALSFLPSSFRCSFLSLRSYGSFHTLLRQLIYKYHTPKRGLEIAHHRPFDRYHLQSLFSTDFGSSCRTFKPRLIKGQTDLHKAQQCDIANRSASISNFYSSTTRNRRLCAHTHIPSLGIDCTLLLIFGRPLMQAR